MQERQAEMFQCALSVSGWASLSYSLQKRKFKNRKNVCMYVCVYVQLYRLPLLDFSFIIQQLTKVKCGLHLTVAACFRWDHIAPCWCPHVIIAPPNQSDVLWPEQTARRRAAHWLSLASSHCCLVFNLSVAKLSTWWIPGDVSVSTHSWWTDSVASVYVMKGNLERDFYQHKEQHAEQTARKKLQHAHALFPSWRVDFDMAATLYTCAGAAHVYNSYHDAVNSLTVLCWANTVHGPGVVCALV